jgi:hypothetical protein
MSEQNPTLHDVLLKILVTSNKLSAATSELGTLLSDIQYMAIGLSQYALENNLDDSIVELLKSDVRFAATLKEEDLVEFRDKVIGYIEDFVEFITKNEEFKKVLNKED